MLVQRCCAIGFLLSGVVFCADPAPGEALPAAEIMRRVAENQDRLQKERSDFVYDQKIRVISRRANGKVICQQETQYVIVPKEKSTERTLVSTRVKYWHDGRFVNFDKDPSGKDETLDTGLVKSFRDDFTHSDSRDGIEQNLFPLTSKGQKDLDFELDGERVIAGRRAYVIRFRPKNRKDLGWAGEALIDRQEFQPATVYTRLSRKLPFFVRTMLGTDLPGLGFTTQYTRVDKGIWFPSSFGTEFKVHAVYFFHRTISVSMENKNFHRTNVDTQIHCEPVQ